MTHHCKVLLLTCIDFRFHKDIDRKMEDLGLAGDYDRVSIAGSSKSLSDPEVDRDREFIIGQIQVSIKLHQVEKMIMVNHQDCGAYGGTQAFQNEQEEFEVHVQAMKNTGKIVSEKFPELQIEMYFAKIDQSGAIEFEKIE